MFCSRYSDFKDIKNGTAADCILRNKTHEITKNPKYYGGLVYKYFDTKLQVVVLNLCNKMNN